MKNIIWIFLLMFVTVRFEQLFAQCPGADHCEDAEVFCSLDDLNGFSCSTTGVIPGPCNPFCSKGGKSNNTSWWAFVCEGTYSTITINTGNCANGKGLDWAVWQYCGCANERMCLIGQWPNTSQSLDAFFQPCQPYYIAIDGLDGDVCDFTINTSGGAAPKIAPLVWKDAPNDERFVCIGDHFYLELVPQWCYCWYTWTLNGQPDKGYSNAPYIWFYAEKEGDFVICATAYIGNITNGSICDQLGPKCATMHVSRGADRNEKPKTFCYEAVNPGGYKWNSQIIYTSGSYREPFVDKDGCPYDSVLEVTVLPKPEIPDVFYISCDNKPYVDMLGRSYLPCKDHYTINLAKTTKPFSCDSAIKLTFLSVEYVPRFRTQCIGGKIDIASNINFVKPCMIGESYENFEYHWYKKSDPSKNSLGTNDHILVDVVKEDYCLEVTVKVHLETEMTTCKKTFCISIDKNDFLPYCFPLAGDQIICNGNKGFYWIDTILSQHVTFYNWSVLGGIIQSKKDSSAIEVKWNLLNGDTGTVCVNYETDCGKSCEKCMRTVIHTAPLPDAGPDDSICLLTNKFKGKKDVGGTWRQIEGPGNSIIVDTSDPTSDVIVDKFGIYQFAYTETNLGCTTTDTVALYFNSNPQITTVKYICKSDRSQYKVHLHIEGGVPPYSILQGNGSIDTNNVYYSDFYDNMINYTIVIKDAMGCETSFDFSHECECTNAIGSLNTNAEFICEDQRVQVVYDNQAEHLNADDTLIYVVTTDPNPDNASSGSFLKIVTVFPILFDGTYLSYNTQYYIFVLVGKKDGNGSIDFSSPCVLVTGPKPFVYYKIPSPYAGVDDSICGAIYNLKGISSISGSNLKWTVISGNGVQITDDTLLNTSINANGHYGTYVLELKEDNHGCVVADRVTIKFNSIPFIAVDEKKCIENIPPFRYLAILKITNGQAPFTIVQGGGSILGNEYTTDTLLSLDKFSVVIKDVHGCTSNLVVDDYNCNCGVINAGQLDTTLTEVCVDQCVKIKSLIDETTDPEDAVIYVLHQSSYNETNPAFPKIDTFYSKDDLICFHPNQMVTGHTYYITRVVGDSIISNGKKIVRDNDPCIRASNNKAIIWYDYPTPKAGQDDGICLTTYKLKGIIKTGAASWKYLSGPGQSNFVFSYDPQTTVYVNQAGTYIYELTEDLKGCIAKDTVAITYWDSPKWDYAFGECDNIQEHYRIFAGVKGGGDISSWFITGQTKNGKIITGNFTVPNRWVSDWIPYTGKESATLTLDDKHHCRPDMLYLTNDTCYCYTYLGTLDKNPIILCKDGIAKAIYNASTGRPDSNDVVRFVLFDGNPLFPKTGNNLSYDLNGNFSFDPGKMQLGKKYYIAVFLGNVDPKDSSKILLSDRCLRSDVVPVIWYDYPVAKISSVENTLTCSKTSITLNGNLSSSGSGTSLSYQWSTSDGNIIGASNNNSATINAPGTYKLMVTDTLTKCTHEVSYSINTDFTKPILHIDSPKLITCDRLQVILDASKSSQGNKYNFHWTGPGKIVNDNTDQATVDAEGIYRLIITDKNNGCVDSIFINVSSDLAKPFPDIKPLGQFTCAIKQIQLDASASKSKSGTIRVYNWQTTNGSIIAGSGSTKITIDKPGIYQLNVIDQNNGCDSTTLLEIIEMGNPLVGINLLAQNPKCFGEQNGLIDVNGIIANGNSTGLQYSLNDGPFLNNSSFSNLSQGSYHLKVKDSNGCEHDTTVTLIEPGPLSIQVIKTIYVDQGTPVNLDSMLLRIAGGTPGYKDTSWFELNQKIKWLNLHYLADTTRNFLITVTDAAGCQIQESIEVIVKIEKEVWWPSVFSPNGDGTNELWNIKGKQINNIRTLNIYDRWGELVFSAKNIKDGNADPNAGWNGMFKEQKASPGVYVFYAELEIKGSNGYDKYKGDLTLLR